MQIKKMTGVDVTMTTAKERKKLFRFEDSLRLGKVERSIRRQLVATLLVRKRQGYLRYLRRLRSGGVPFVAQHARSLMTEAWESGVGSKYKAIYEAQTAHMPPFLLFTRSVHSSDITSLLRRGLRLTYDRAKARLVDDSIYK